MRRIDAIDRLVDESINNFFDRPDPADYLSYLFRNGLSAFNHMANKELENEYYDTFGEEIEIN